MVTGQSSGARGQTLPAYPSGRVPTRHLDWERMSELADLMAVFGAVDRAVAGDERRLLPAVASLVPEYNHRAAGWFDGVQIWAEQGGRALAAEGQEYDVQPPDLSELPDAGTALDNLIAAEPDPGLVGRRLLAVALLSRVQPVHSTAPPDLSTGSVSDGKLADALAPMVDDSAYHGTLSLQSRSMALLDILRNARSRPAMVQAALQQELITQAAADQVISPMTWTVVPSTEAGGPAVAFETRFWIDGTALSDVAGVLEPAQWTGFTPPWCEMKPMATPAATAPGAVSRWREVIALECGNTPPLLVLRTVLDFRFQALPDGSGSALEYRLADGQLASGGDGMVTVDEGSLVTRKLGTGVEVITTKRIQFRAFSRMLPLEAAGLAWFVWLMGYSSLAEYFVEQVAHIPAAKIHRVGSHWGGGPSTDPAPPAGGQSVHPGVAPQSSHHYYISQLDHTAAAIEEAFGECWKDLQSSLGKMSAGQNGPAAYLGDAVKMSSHLARHGSLMLKFWASVVPEQVHGTNPR